MKLMFNGSQLRLLAETLSNVGVIFFASLVVPIFIAPIIDSGVVIGGLTLSATFWIMGLLVIKNISP